MSAYCITIFRRVFVTKNIICVTAQYEYVTIRKMFKTT